MSKLRKLWRAFYGYVVMLHADHYTGYERLRVKYEERQESDV